MEILDRIDAVNDPKREKKFRVAGVSFFILNIIYFCLFFLVVAPF